MKRKAKIRAGYKEIAGGYDTLLSTQNLWAKLACKLIWGFPDTAYAGKLLSLLPEDFSGRLLDIPVGTGLFTCETYAKMKYAQLVCADYSEDMLAHAKRRLADAGIENADCVRCDVGTLPFTDASFDIVLSMNGFHAFPDKEAAYEEIYRVLKTDGTFLGCFYVRGETRRTDWFVRNIYVPRGYFTPPFETLASLRLSLEKRYRSVQMWSVGAIAWFCCVK
jgi:ubiquinone/menaquinone biosynthesis C-methylase UbiE